jgi:uncharacterized RDD family membrane protein YckC
MNATTYAGFWKRFAAYLIDSTLLTIAALIILLPPLFLLGFGAAMSEAGSDEAGPGMVLGMVVYLLGIGVVFVASWLYHALMESSSKGATLGKMALGIRVTDMQGNRITFGRASGRYFGKFLSNLTFGIGYVIAGFTQRKQALHDMVAGCLVVNT